MKSRNIGMEPELLPKAVSNLTLTLLCIRENDSSSKFLKKFGFRIDWEEWKLCPFYKHGRCLSHGIFYRLRYPLS